MKEAVKLSSMAAQGDEGQSTSKSRNFHFHNSSSDESDNESVERTTFSVFASEEEALEISEWGGGCKPSRAREEEKERESTKKVKADTQEWKRCTAAKGALSRSLSALNNLVLGNLIDTGQTGRPDFKYAGTRFLAHGSRLLFSLFSLSLSLSPSLCRLFVLALHAFTRTSASSRVWLLPFYERISKKKDADILNIHPKVNFYDFHWTHDMDRETVTNILCKNECWGWMEQYQIEGGYQEYSFQRINRRKEESHWLD